MAAQTLERPLVTWSATAPAPDSPVRTCCQSRNILLPEAPPSPIVPRVGFQREAWTVVIRLPARQGRHQRFNVALCTVPSTFKRNPVDAPGEKTVSGEPPRESVPQAPSTGTYSPRIAGPA